VFHPEMYTQQPVARETAETVWAPHASYALAVLCAASPGVAGRGGAQFSSVSSVQFSSVQFIAVQVRSGQFSSDIACTHACIHWLPTAVHYDAIAFGRKIPYPASKFKELQEASSDAEIERLKKLPYLQLVGALLYLSTMSRPDIAHHMSVLCSFMQNPSLQCFEAAQSVLLYVAHTKNLTIRYSRTFAVPECFTP